MKAISQVANNVLALFSSTRAMTRELVSTLEDDDYVIQTAEYTSPPKWHIGHTSWIYEMVMKKIDPDYVSTKFASDPYLNSYYNQAGPIHPKNARGSVARPSTQDLVEYFEEMNGRVNEFVSKKPQSPEDTRLLLTAVHHECQHQELMIYDIQHMLGSKYVPKTQNQTPQVTRTTNKDPVKIKGGVYEIGYSGDEYSYDIESPSHKVYLEDYEIDAYPVTCGQFTEFINSGGYKNYRYWLSDGWDTVQENSWKAPMYWEMGDNGWLVRDFGGLRSIENDEPVCNVSYYEADAYCRWAKRRLPTESEWEIAACYDSKTGKNNPYPWGDAKLDSSKANLLESRMWQCAPIGSYGAGSSPSGCEQMIGDVWEWTSSEFSPYPGFESGFEEYNDKWFGNQKVLRGGSFATPINSIRSTYRNFFRPHERWMFAGFRSAL